MKKHVKILGTLSAVALASLAVTSCTNKNPNEDTSSKPTEETKGSETQGDSTESTTPSTTESTTSDTTESTSTTGGDSTTESSTSSSTTPTVEYSISINTDKVTLEYVVGQTFSYEGLVVTDSTGSTLEIDNTNVIVDASSVTVDDNGNLSTLGEYTVIVIVKHDGKKYTKNFTVNVVKEIVKQISSVDDFLAMRQYNDSTGYNSYSYKLTCDLDLEGKSIPDAAANFKGTFDGQGHTIKNANYVAGSTKLGLLFKNLVGEGTVQNLKFFNCSVSSASETCAFIAGETNVTNSNVTIKSVEFNLCTVTSANNYAGMAIGRVETGANVTINLEDITVKNYSSVTCFSYGGGIVGDILKDTTVNAKNLDIDMTTSTGQNGSQLVGRNRGGNINAENIIFRGAIAQSTTSCGFLTGGGATSASIVANSILILGTHPGTADVLVGNSKATTLTLTNIYYVDKGGATVKEDYTQVTSSDVTSAWCLGESSTLKLDDAWEADASQVVKLKSASSNTPSEGATVASLQLSTTSVKKEYFEADTFTTDGISLISIYSDGALKISQTPSKVKILNSNNEEVTLTDGKFTGVATGDYTVVVTEGEKSASYTIQVVKYESTVVESGDTSLVYVAGNTLDLSKVYVYSTKTNGTKDYVALKNCTVTVVNGETTVKDGDVLSAVGTYTVTVTANGFSGSYKFEVVAADEASEAYVKTVVDASQTESQKWTAVESAEATSSYKGYYTFNTIEKAVNYLTNLGLSDDAVKVIEVKAGTYREKVTVSIPNVTIVGEGQGTTTLVWNAAEGTETLSGNGTYGMTCATLIATEKAIGFNLSNISVTNDFDYVNSSLADKQAFAFQSDADKTTVKNVTFSSVQDTLYANKGRQYYYQCTIKGAVDYVFGQGDVTAYFDECTFHTVARVSADGTVSKNTGYIFAPKSEVSADKLTYNYVVVNSTFEADQNVPDESISVARPWGAKGGVAVIESSFTKHYSKAAYTGSGKPRYDAMNNQSPADANFYEYGNTGEGSISEAVTGVKFLTEEEAANYKDITKVLAEVNGKVDYKNGEFTPKTESIVKTFVEWELGQDSYDTTADSEFKASTIHVYDLAYNSTTGVLTTYKAVTTAVEKYYNADGEEVTTDTIIKNAGTYTVKLVYGEKVLGDKTITTAAGQTTTTIDWTYGGEEWTYTTTNKDISAAGYNAGDFLGTGNLKVNSIKGSDANQYVESSEFVSSKTAKVSIVAGTTGSGDPKKVQVYKVDALDKDGNVVGTVNISITGCGDSNKNKMLFQSDEVTLTSETSFVKLRIYAVSAAGNKDKSHTITQIKTILS